MTDVAFYLDYSCPWSYLALTRLTETAIRTGARIVFLPIVVDWVLEQTNPALARDRRETDPAKARYRNKDLSDWAEFCGVTLNTPAGWPAHSELAARGALAADQQGQCRTYSGEIFRAYFEADEDLEDVATVVGAAERAGLDLERFRVALADEALAARLRANCRELVDRGGFGCPTLFVGEAMFFGNDRIPLVEFALGQASGRLFVPPGDHSA